MSDSSGAKPSGAVLAFPSASPAFNHQLDQHQSSKEHGILNIDRSLPDGVHVTFNDAKAAEKYLNEQANKVIALHHGQNAGVYQHRHMLLSYSRNTFSELQMKRRAVSNSNGNTAPSLAMHYNAPWPPPANRTHAPTIGIISLGGFYQLSDLQTYWQNMCGFKAEQMPTVVNVAVDGARYTFGTDQGADQENTLDLEIAGATCPGCKLVFYSAPNTTLGFYDAIRAAIYDTANRPQYVSISWGAPESAYGNAAMTSFNQLFQNGVTNHKVVFTVASGDDGSSDGTSKQAVDFPSSSPWVTSCGGTKLTTPESAWSWVQGFGGTGGGISALFDQPSWQKGVVIFPTNTVPALPANLLNKRAVPDISFNADPQTGWTIYYANNLYVNAFGGTSCVAPFVAGLLGLMNMTFPNSFNQSLYAAQKLNPKCFNDILIGTNDSVRGSTRLFTAGPGYDEVTGLGTVNGTVLMQTLLANPSLATPR